MTINEKQLKKVIVETQSGQVLGKVTDFQLDPATGVIAQYEVKSGLLSQILLINKEQIISFDENKMIVEDAVVKTESETQEVLGINKIEGVEPAITSEME